MFYLSLTTYGLLPTRLVDSGGRFHIGLALVIDISCNIDLIN